MVGIYKITNILNNKIYVGQSLNIPERWKNHVRYLNNCTHHNTHLQYSWNKYGCKYFEFSIIETCEEEVLNDKEEYWIKRLDAYKKGYNLTKGGDGTRGYVFTEEERKKMSLAQKGNKKWLGKKHSEETKAKMSLNNTGRVFSEETKRKISLSHIGKKASEETKIKLSIAHKGLMVGEKNPMYGKGLKGKDNPMYGRKGSLCPSSKKIYSNERLFNCVSDCALYFGIGYSSMRSYLNGQRKMPEKLKHMNLHYIAE